MLLPILPGRAQQTTTAPPANGIQSLSTYQQRYGETKPGLSIDPAADLPSYPAVEPDAATATWTVKEGFRLRLAAHEPQVTDPIAICFDERGRLFACEMIDYSEMRDHQPHLGRVSMLEDRDGDGVYETSTVFADNLPWPTGLIWANNQLFVIATPDIWSFRDTTDDGRADRREKVFTGFGTGLKMINVQGMANSPQWGLDNRVHVLAGGGNRGLVSSPKRPDLEPVELGGNDFWFDPLTLEYGLETGGAQYGMSYDDLGRKFGCSNSNHLQHWAYDHRLAADHPHHRLPASRGSIAADGPAAEVFRLSPDEPWRILRTRWRVSGVVKGSVEGGGRVSGYFTGATGTTIYRGDALGEDFLNNSFTGDAGGQLVHRKIIRRADDGVNLVGARPEDEKDREFAASNDTWVRVVNFANAPDGCLYVCDMYREVIEHPWSIPEEIKQHLDLNNGNTRGRLWRIEPDRPDWQRRAAPALHTLATAELAALLEHPNGWHRDTAHRLLVEKQDKAAVPTLRTMARQSKSAATVLHALGVLAALDGLDRDILNRCLESSTPEVVERALLWSLETPDAAPGAEVLVKLADSGKPERSRFLAMLALSRLWSDDMSAGAADLAAAAAQTLKDADGNSWLLAAVQQTPPALAASIFIHGAALGVPASASAPLLVTVGARGVQSEMDAVAAIIREQPAAARTTLVTALAEGVRKAGGTLEKADKSGQLAAVFDAAIRSAANSASPAAERSASLVLLGLSTRAEAAQTLLQCLAAGEPAPIQKVALATLAKRNAADLADTLLGRWSGLQPEARADALAALLQRPDRSRVLLEKVGAADAPSPADFTASQVQDLIAHKDQALAKLARERLASVIPPSREEVAATFAPSIELKGDAAAGRNHFIGRCMACHVAEGMGQLVGPDMVTVKTRGRDGILEAILDPHKEVAPQFISYTFTKKDGAVLAGIITRDDASGVALKMMGGAEVFLPRAEIQGSSSTGQSLMPEGLETGMSPQDMADLLAFIESL
jgi:putative membrane-bound dehydrogenase-like protein